MPVPKRKTSKRRRNQRHANKGLDVQTITHCPNSGSPMMPHTVCLESGYYKGVKVMRTKQDRLQARGLKKQAKKGSAQDNQEGAQDEVVAKETTKKKSKKS